MKSTNNSSRVLSILLGIVTLLAAVIAADQAINKIVTPEKLGGKERILTYLSTDKPIYRSGEKVYMRLVALDAATNFPLRNHASGHITVKGPKGDIVFRGGTQMTDSVGGCAWEIPAGQAGGQYTIIASVNGSAGAERKFEIRAYAPPRLKTQIEFLRKGYGPGDEASATVNIQRAEGGVPADAKITAVARIDGAEVFRKDGYTVDSNGNCTASFKLPENIAVGDGTLAFIIEDGGVKETASKTIPILLQTLDISFYPEGGELVAGIPCRVYVQARRPDGKPADIEGTISIASSLPKNLSKVADLQTSHEGRGYFEFTPKKGTPYWLNLAKPAGIKKVFALPEVKPEGATVKSLRDVYPYDGKIALAVDSTKNSGAAKVTLFKREVQLDAQPVDAGKSATVTLDPKDAEGVLIATVWDKNDRPLAERLIFRKPKFAVNVKITPESKAFVPGGEVTLNIETTDVNGSPVEAVVGLTVTDDAVLEMIEKREQAPNLPVMVYLENEVKDLADAQVYFDDKNPQSQQAVDLLLGTQGWRRFVLVNFDDLMKTDRVNIRRAMAQMLIGTCGGITKGRGIAAFRAKAVAKGAVEVDDMAVPAAAMPEERVAAVEANKPLNGEMAAFEGVKDKATKADAPAKPIMAKEVEVIQGANEPEFLHQEIAREERADRFAAKMYRPMPYIVIREYAHKVRPGRKPNDRVDFTETLYWNAGVRTNPRTGMASVTFGLSDGVTTFRVLADAFGNNGALGAASSAVKSLEPFYIEPKLPQQATAGDVIDLPVAIVNSTDKSLGAANLIVKGDGFTITQAAPVELSAGQRGRAVVKLIVPQKAGKYALTLTAAAGGYTDTVTRNIIVSPLGFPMANTAGGQIGPDAPFGMNIDIPADVEPGSMTTLAKIFPTPLANMEEALNALLQQPNGCFEQTSSTAYPLIMAQQYFTSHQGVDPAKIARAKELLEDGYKKLTGFECKEKGYEWFGGDPAHESLTAYGLLEFNDMSKVMPVDSNMMSRTRAWILDRRDGQGGFKRNDRALDSFGRAPQWTTNAYVVWALIESGENPAGLQKEIAAVKAEAMKSKDSYLVALAANILYKTGDNGDAKKLSQKLVDAVEKDGSVGGGETSITCSGGDSLKIETTSLAILAWLKDGSYADAVEKSMKWLFETCKAGRFGTTQSTVLALKAINAYDQSRAKPEKPGSVQLMIDGKPFGAPAKFDKDVKGAIELPDFAAAMTAGNHRIELVMTDGVKMPFAIEVKYNTPLPPSSDKCNLKLTTALSASTITEGEPLEAEVTVTVGEKDAPTPIAIIGIPAGLEVRHDQLKELVSAKRIDSYEIIGNEVVLYWRALKAGSVVKVPLSLTAAIPGKYTGSASRDYLYYTDEYKCWVKGMSVTINAR